MLNLGPDAWPAIALTLKLSAATTAVLLIVATPLAWWLSQTASRWRAPVSALVTLPLVLPPTVLGFYLLIALGPQGPLGRLTQALGWGVWSFTFTGLLIGSPGEETPPLRGASDFRTARPTESSL